jgi:hypothetical protein
VSHNRMSSPRRLSARTIAFVVSAAAFVSPVAADSGSSLADLTGQWGRDMLFFEPPPSGPGPVISAIRKADGTIVARDPCCATGNPGGWLGDHSNPVRRIATAPLPVPKIACLTANSPTSRASLRSKSEVQPANERWR